jgi:homoserine/homoserine lactone efflux protein
LSFETWLLFIGVAVAPAFSPGPAIVLAVANAVRFGTTAAVWSSLGNAAGMFLLGLAVTAGLGAVLAFSATAFTVLKFAAMGYLVWLGIRMIRDRSVPDLAAAPVVPRRRLFGQAFVVAITNPKAVVLLAALLPGFISAEGSALAQGAILSATFAALTVLSHRVYALVFGRARRLLGDARRLQLFRRVLGGSLVGFGIGLAIAGR